MVVMIPLCGFLSDSIRYLRERSSQDSLNSTDKLLIETDTRTDWLKGKFRKVHVQCKQRKLLNCKLLTRCLSTIRAWLNWIVRISEKYHAELLCIGCIGLQSLHFFNSDHWCISTLSSKSNASTCSFSANRNVKIISYSQSDFSSGHDTIVQFSVRQHQICEKPQDSELNRSRNLKMLSETDTKTDWLKDKFRCKTSRRAPGGLWRASFSYTSRDKGADMWKSLQSA